MVINKFYSIIEMSYHEIEHICFDDTAIVQKCYSYFTPQCPRECNFAKRMNDLEKVVKDENVSE